MKSARVHGFGQNYGIIQSTCTVPVLYQHEEDTDPAPCTTMLELLAPEYFLPTSNRDIEITKISDVLVEQWV
jgi:hypothetical protein